MIIVNPETLKQLDTDYFCEQIQDFQNSEIGIEIIRELERGF